MFVQKEMNWQIKSVDSINNSKPLLTLSVNMFRVKERNLWDPFSQWLGKSSPLSYFSMRLMLWCPHGRFDIYCIYCAETAKENQLRDLVFPVTTNYLCISFQPWIFPFYLQQENEHEASRRMKTEFMTQVDGATTSAEDRILIMAATNIPWELDEAVLRYVPKDIFYPLTSSTIVLYFRH